MDEIIVGFYYLAHPQLPRSFSLNIYIATEHCKVIYPCKPTKKQVREAKKKYIPWLKSILKRNRRTGG